MIQTPPLPAPLSVFPAIIIHLQELENPSKDLILAINGSKRIYLLFTCIQWREIYYGFPTLQFYELFFPFLHLSHKRNTSLIVLLCYRFEFWMWNDNIISISCVADGLFWWLWDRLDMILVWEIDKALCKNASFLWFLGLMDATWVCMNFLMICNAWLITFECVIIFLVFNMGFECQMNLS